jgi:hypothetical protein
VVLCLGRRLIGTIMSWVRGRDSGLRAAVMKRVNGLMLYLAQLHYPGGRMAVTRPTGYMVIWVAILLAAYLWLLLSFPNEMAGSDHH